MLKRYAVIYFICNAVLYSGIAEAQKLETEGEIKKKILTDYDTSLSPVLYSSGIQFTVISFSILRVRGLDEQKGEFIVEGPIVEVWSDERLSWDSDTVVRLIIPTEEIWVPSLRILNWIEPCEVTLDTLPRVMNGIAGWGPRYTIKTRCNLSLRYFPFDTQICNVIIVSSTYEGDDLSANFTAPGRIDKLYANTNFLIENPQWIVEDIVVKRKKMNIDRDTRKSVAVYTFTIRRSMHMIPVGILTPCITCVLLLLTTFWMPAGSNLRTGISVTSMLVSSSSLFSLGRILPASGSSTPIIVEYVSVTLILSAVSSIETMVASIFRRCQKLPPMSYNTIILKFPHWCLLLLGISPEKEVSQQLDEKFLFSELDDPENKNISETDSTTNIAQNKELQSVQSLWVKYIILFDRMMFYILGLIILLFIVSVIITE